VQLFADRSRQLAEADPRGRDLVISCGAALHHLQVALVAAGWAPRVHRLPDERNPDHLATVDMVATTPDDDQLRLAEAIIRRRSERRRLTSWEVPDQHLQRLAEAAQHSGALLAGSSELQIRHRLIFAFSEAAARQGEDPAYQSELSLWSGRGSLADVGVPSANVPSGSVSDPTRREFPRGHAMDAAPEAGDDIGGELLVLASTSDNVRSQLLAGEALSATLLTATSKGLATCALTQPLEVEHTRRLIHEELLGGAWTPQVLVRVGWLPDTLQPLPHTPRQRLEDVLTTIAPEGD
jgi:hypothetical protein